MACENQSSELRLYLACENQSSGSIGLARRCRGWVREKDSGGGADVGYSPSLPSWIQAELLMGVVNSAATRTRWMDGWGR